MGWEIGRLGWFGEHTVGTDSKMAQDGAKEPEECKKRQRKRGPAPETHTEWMWNDSTSPISLGCQGCCGEVGASDQAIQAFKHPQAFHASSLDELTSLSLLLLDPDRSHAAAPSVFLSLQPHFLSHSLKYTALLCLSFFLSFFLSFVSFSLVNPLLHIFTPLFFFFSSTDLYLLTHTHTLI